MKIEKKEKLHRGANIIYILLQLEFILDANLFEPFQPFECNGKKRASLKTMIIVRINSTIKSLRVGLKNYFDIGDEVRQFIFDFQADRLEINLSSIAAAHVPLCDKGVIYRRLYE